MAKLAAETGNSQWQAQKKMPGGVLGFLWYDPGLEAEKPVDLPRAKHFCGIEVTVLRSNREDDRVFLGFKSGESVANHSLLRGKILPAVSILSKGPLFRSG